MSTHKPVDWTKELRTYGGKRARLIGTVNRSDKYTYVVAVQEENESSHEAVYKYTADGMYLTCPTDNDLINPPVRIQREVWANVYHDCVATHNTRQSADNCAAQSARLACVKITILCTEGEGL